MIVRLRALSEALRSSLFFVPALAVLVSIALAAGMLALDRSLELSEPPSLLRFTVDSARELLTTMAGAIITVAAIVFALTGLSVQLASSQFSPRVVRGFLRDRRQQVSIGFMVGTFTYTLVVLRSVRSAEGDPDVVPVLSTALALALTVVGVVVIVAFVSRTAHRLQSSELIRAVAAETLDAVDRQLRASGQGGSPSLMPAVAPSGPGWGVRARSMGWVAQVSTEELLELLPPGGLARVEVQVGQFVHPGRRLCTLWVDLEDPGKVDHRVNRSFAIGPARTMQEDFGFGIRQLVDIALRALSPGVNDPTTAYECVVHLGAVVYRILGRDLPPADVVGDDGRRVVLPGQLTYGDYVEQAFDEIRQSAVPLPSFAAAMVRTLADVAADLAQDGIVGERVQPLARQAELLLVGVEQSCPLPEDVLPVRENAKLLPASVHPRRGAQ